MNAIRPVILCGGSGTRLWPLSREGFPKQFLCLTGNESLFQLAVKRVTGLGAGNIVAEPPLIVTSEEHRFLALEQLREIKIRPEAIILEPIARNTAPALTLAALAATEAGQDPVLVVTPADHTVGNEAAFATAIQGAIEAALTGHIAVLGITPKRAEVGYGYIQAHKVSDGPTMTVRQFTEKPSIAVAEAFVKAGDYYWNAGIFVLRASVWLASLERLRPDISQPLRLSWDLRRTDQDFVRPAEAEFRATPSDSIDYAVIERCLENKIDIRMVQLDAQWSDLGAWDAVWRSLPKDDNGNAHHGDVISIDSMNTLVYATSRLVSLVGMKDLVVIETPDAVLVSDKVRCQDVKHVVQVLTRCKREEHFYHRKVHRPWGWYDTLDDGHRFKVKRISVNPGASLSLQMHNHRAEHWIVVKGTAAITCGSESVLLSENQSTYIPLGKTHRLANPGTIPLEIIEVQSGSYLGEDDIIRIDDNYGRHTASDGMVAGEWKADSKA